MTEFRLAEDADLLPAIAAGRESALDVLYDRYHRQCFAFSLRILASEPDAEEAVQETFVRVWRNARVYDPGKASVGSWVLSITRNLCVDELRRRRRRAPQTYGLDGDQHDSPSGERTDEQAERAVMGEKVRGALHSLPSEQRSAIELVYFHGLSSQEVGKLLGVPSPTIRSRLRLGLLKLGGILQAQGVVSHD